MEYPLCCSLKASLHLRLFYTRKQVLFALCGYLIIIIHASFHVSVSLIISVDKMPRRLHLGPGESGRVTFNFTLASKASNGFSNVTERAIITPRLTASTGMRHRACPIIHRFDQEAVRHLYQEAVRHPNILCIQ